MNLTTITMIILTIYCMVIRPVIITINIIVIFQVCRIANKNCKLVFDVYTNCWDTKAGETARGGLGMMAGWFDACGGKYEVQSGAWARVGCAHLPRLQVDV